jgi:predicted transglutaminase-like cysteine proteinase
LIVYLQVTAKEMIDIDEKTIDQIQKTYGPGAVKRLESWQDLVRSDDSSSDMEKLEKVNRFFNEYPFVDDAIHWKKEDYWATPIEFIASLGGDCEDFSLAKYFTLKEMGVPEEKLYLTYVKALKLNQAHMVLTYYEKPSAEPLVLDNLNQKIIVASKRQDLLPVYSFNGDGLWLAKQRGKGKFVGDSQRLKRWQDLKSRMAKGL